MTHEEIAALLKDIDILHVWPQSIADHHADTLAPRQIEKLYEVGVVATLATTALRQLVAENEGVRGALRAERLKPCRHTRTLAEQPDRADLKAWQESQSEWLDPTILGIVSEYAAWRDDHDQGKTTALKLIARRESSSGDIARAALGEQP
ncbi:MAG: hypothetical protein A3E01_09100 [Gammaproteobacteria bacterium RIFCSPHIGHO2_12_FULL_63_22]|nr:MAG: hypothetical protein A3E01_09100 [Gammaproteobacteria bacterium RIFCSPHIGHO2_12_FULL_63_22]